MKRITGLYQELRDAELYCGQEELLESPENSLEEAAAERILQRAIKKVTEENNRENPSGQEKKRIRRTGRRKILVLAAAAVFLLGLTASAAGYLGIRAELARLLGISVNTEAESLESMVADPAGNAEEKGDIISAEKDGVKITASQIFSDGETVYLYFDVELPDGIYPENAAEGDFRDGVSEESNPVRFHRTRCLDHGQDIGIAGMMVQKDREREEGYYAIGLLTLEEIKEQSSKKVTLELEDFGYIESGAKTTEWVTLVPGTWTLELTLDCEDVSQTYTVQKEFSTPPGTFCIESVRISPLSIKLTGNSDHLDAIMEDAQTSIEIEGFLMSDGILKQLLTWSYTGPEDGKLVLGGSFDQMVDPEQIVGVRILGEDLLFRDASF